jgi:hypothetical protein
MARFLYRLSCAGLLGAQVFFAAVAAQVPFRAGLERRVAGDLAGAMLQRLDSAALAICAIAVLCAVLLGRRRLAVPPLLAGTCALLSSIVVTPKIHALRVAGETGSPTFGRLHAVSAVLLLTQVGLLIVAVWLAPGSAERDT